jgi:Putative zinc-finger
MLTESGLHACDDELERYVLGGLDEPEVAEMEEHLLVCSTCQTRLEETESFIIAMRSAAAKLRAQPPSAWERLKSRFPRLMAMPTPVWATAAVAALVVCVLALAPSILTRPSATSAFAVALEAARGTEGLAESRVPANSPLLLSMDLSEFPARDSYKVEVVDALGKTEMALTVAPANKRLVANTGRALGAGRHWVRLYSSSEPHTLLREYGVKAE